MYIKKEEKLQIIRWYIRKYVRYDKDISAITNLKGLEDIIRTHTDYNCKACGWAVYGLLGDLGKGVFVYVKEKLHGDNIFMPIAWEEEN